jgi:hypothetical protein
MLGRPVPDFSLPSTGDSTYQAPYFHPKTSKDFSKANCRIWKFPFELFGVISIKNMYRRKVRGIERSTFNGAG